jgi:hypothetical protein
MFNALMGMFNDPIFWTMVVAVMVGYIFAKALPYILIVLTYGIAAIAWMLGLTLGVIVGIIGYGIISVKLLYLQATKPDKKKGK